MPDQSSFFTLHLAGFVHLTLSFDGWSSKGHNEIYTVHITTPLRCSFLIDGLVLTGLSVSGDVLFNYLSAVCSLCVLICWG